MYNSFVCVTACFDKKNKPNCKFLSKQNLSKKII